MSISLGLAWVIAVFLELAIFADTIEDKIKRDQVAANQAILQKVEQFETRLGHELTERRKELSQLEELYRAEFTTPAPTESEQDRSQIAALNEQIANLDLQEQALRKELRDAQVIAARHAEEMHAEQLGQRINERSSGRAGAGPRYMFALQQKELYEARVKQLESEIAQLHSKGRDLRDRQRHLTEAAAARLEQGRSAAQGRRDAISNQMETARAELAELETSLLARIENFRQGALSAPDYHKQRNDPLARMTAYQELKNDPKEGQTITLFSWMTKFLVIFLEIAPIVAKMFFSPRSVYGIRIQTMVETEQLRAMREYERAVLDQSSANEPDSRGVEPLSVHALPPASAKPIVAAAGAEIASAAAERLAEAASVEHETLVQTAPAERKVEFEGAMHARAIGQAAMSDSIDPSIPAKANSETVAPPLMPEAPVQDTTRVAGDRTNPITDDVRHQEDAVPELRPGDIDPQMQYDMDDVIEIPDEIPRRERAVSSSAEPDGEDAVVHFPGKKSAKIAT